MFNLEQTTQPVFYHRATEKTRTHVPEMGRLNWIFKDHAQEPVSQRSLAPIATQADAGRIGTGPGGEGRLRPRPDDAYRYCTYAFR